MEDIIPLVGSQQAVEILGVRMVGVNAEYGKKLLLTLVFIALTVLLGYLLRVLTTHAGMARRALGGRAEEKAEFCTRQAIKLGRAKLCLRRLSDARMVRG